MTNSTNTQQVIFETLEYIQGIFEHIQYEQPTAEQIQKLVKVAGTPLLEALSISKKEAEQPSTPAEQSNADLIPLYGIYRNDEPIFITGSIQTAYPERVAHDIKAHLQAVSDDAYTLEVIQWVEDGPGTVPFSHTDKWEGK